MTFAKITTASRRGLGATALLGGKYNGKGHNGRVTWDPYGTHNNIKKGDYIGLKACIVDGPSGAPFPGCTEGTRRSVDG